MRLLEIAIPTYNREPQLLRLLASILLQSNDDIYRWINIVIYDNSDQTSSEVIHLLTLLGRKGAATAYRKNPQNIGGGANIAQSYSKSSSAWTLVVGDDDYFMPSSLQRILYHIREADSKNIGLVQYGFACIDDDNFIRFVHPKSPAKVKIYSPSDAVTSEGSIHDLAFISSLVIKSSVWSELTHAKYNTPVQLYAHVFCILDGLRISGLDALRVGEHLVFSGYGRNEYYNSKVAVARLSEFAAYDQIAFNLGQKCKTSKMSEYKSSGYRRLRLDVAAALKIGVFRDTFYRNHLHLIRYPNLPFLFSRLACKSVYWLTSIPFIRRILKSQYERRRGDNDLSSVDALV